MKENFDYYTDTIDNPVSDRDVWIVGIKRPYYPEIYFYYSESEAIVAYQQLIKEEDYKEEGIHESIVFMSKGSGISHIKTVH